VSGVDGMRHRRVTFERVYAFLQTPQRSHLLPAFFQRFAPRGEEEAFRTSVDMVMGVRLGVINLVYSLLIVEP